MAAPAARAHKVRFCGDGCGGVLPRGSQAKYLAGHAKTAARPIDPADFSPAEVAKFWSRVRLADNGCWEWTGPRDKDGYGRIWFGTRPTDRRKYLAHRVAYALVRGALPGVVELLHRCDVVGLGPGCVNPGDVMEGDHALNAKDAASKGLLNRVLTPSQVLDLRRLHRAGRSANSLARPLGVSPSTVRRVVLGETWQHLLADGWTPAPTRPATCRKGGHVFDGKYTRADGTWFHTCSPCRRENNQNLTARRRVARHAHETA
jgi:hypothetical protein